MSLCFATIIAPNYLAYAQVLAESVRRHAPGAAFRVLIVSRPDPDVHQAVARTGLRATYAPDLGLPDFDLVAYKYDIVEFNTALKPTFLKRLFTEGFERVVYLDPDIQLQAPPAPIESALDDAEIALTPHALAPAMDGLRPSDIDFLRTGTFNLGFIGLRKGRQSAALLDWWERRCLSHGFNDPSFGTFVDQKWLDLAPCYFDGVRILKHPGCNVAYWNLHEREVTGSPGTYAVNGMPLVFFHFSGVDARHPEKLSRHQDRHRIPPGGALARLVSDYCSALLEAGHAQSAQIPYSFSRLHDGTPITPLMRRAAVAEGAKQQDPFDPLSELQRRIRDAGLERDAAVAATTTLNFQAGDRRVRIVNAAIRTMALIIGAGRMAALIRYATFLGWGPNLAALLLKRPFELRHIDERKVETL